MVKSSQDFHPPLPAARSGSVDLLLIAGEHSGDEHAAKLLEELLERDPNLQVACLGGHHLAAAGAQLLYDLSSVSVVGFVEVLKRYSFLNHYLMPLWIGLRPIGPAKFVLWIIRALICGLRSNCMLAD